MIAKRTKHKALGLLPRMEARPRKGGGFTFRYYTYDRRYIPLGHDRSEAIRKVLEIEGRAPDSGTIAELVREYFRSSTYKQLGERTRADYMADSKHVLRVFGAMATSAIKPPHIARYLRVERAAAPVRANREMAFLASVFQFGIESGYAVENPCRQVRRNKERPRSRCPTWAELESLCATAAKKGPSSHVIGLMGKFIALTGRRRAEFLQLRKSDLREDGISIGFAKTKAGEAKRRGLIEWTPALRQLFQELEAVPRKGRGGVEVPESMFVWVNRDGQPYTEAGFKALWAKIMTDWLAEDSSRERFTFHDLRGYYVTAMVERQEDPETHANPATTRRVYDRRRVVKIKGSA